LSAKRFILSTGGTGGHIFPAIAVASEIVRRLPDAEILFVGAKGGMENTMVPDAGFNIISVSVSGIYRRLTLKNVYRNILFPFLYIQGLWQASRILRIFKPDAVIGFGGFASAPTLRMAVNMNIPAAIHEANAYPGVVNKMMASKVQAVLIGNPYALNYVKVQNPIITGNPVRTFLQEGSRESGIKSFGLDSGRPVVFITGGSLGARSLNEAMLACIQMLTEKGIQVIWQCGKLYYDEFTKRLPTSLNGVKLMPFVSNMQDAYACADIVVARAGAMTVSEIAWLKKPAILVPSPNVAEDHQTRNAESLTALNAAVMVKDADAQQMLGIEIIKLLENTNAYNQIVDALKAIPHQDAVQAIADVVIQLAEGRREWN
jgi:UDP-N-acetylglucosamine--N-acetylmuramyl-(pentapeptide) pyrophosphoryl-undecaprenol N-acetylglucosamine transferase